MRAILPGLAAVWLLACPPPKPKPLPPVTGRCDVSLDEQGLFSAVGAGAHAAVVTDASQLIGGPQAHGRVGDYVMANDRVRVVIQQPGRDIGPQPYGGHLIDADLVRSGGVGSGADELGSISPLFNFGRTVNATQIDIIEDGGSGGYAAIAVSGPDVVLDTIDLPNSMARWFGAGTALQVDPSQDLSVLATTYYVLSPGETRVRMLTALCNQGHSDVTLAAGEWVDFAGALDVFNPRACNRGVGVGDCTVDPAPWFGAQGQQLAYGYRAYQPQNTRNPALNALMPIDGVLASFTDAQDETGLRQWTDSTATARAGEFGITAGQSRLLLRDFFVGHDLAEISGTMIGFDAAPHARLLVTTQFADGGVATGIRVGAMVAETGQQTSLGVTDETGVARMVVTPGNYLLSTGSEGSAVQAPTPTAAAANADTRVTLTLAPSHTLTVHTTDTQAGDIPARVVVTCPGGPCAFSPSDFRHLKTVEPLPSNVAAVAYSGSNGLAHIALPLGAYQVFVSRGPEYSAWPSTFPSQGQAVDLSVGDASLDAPLTHVVDTTGFMSAELRAQTVNSATSSVALNQLLGAAAGEGLDVLVTADHDMVTPLASALTQLGLGQLLAGLVGFEVSTFDYGHFTVFGATTSMTPSGGAFDWANGDGPTLRPDQIFDRLHTQFPHAAVQLSQPRDTPSSSLGALLVDTATGATHATPERFRMDSAPGATAADTHLLSNGFDTFEVMAQSAPANALLNDWMTLLSRGVLKAGTAASNASTLFSATTGLGRTWVDVGTDAAASFDGATFSQNLTQLKAVAGAGPFIRFTAQALDDMGHPTGAMVGLGETLSITPGRSALLWVDVQAPVWLQFDSIELYTHADGREATAGRANEDWPMARVSQSQQYDPTSLNQELVPGSTATRVHVRTNFQVTPTADAWFVVIVRGRNSSRAFGPAGWSGVTCQSGTCTASEDRAFSFTNPLFIDADGSGRYDNFPLK